MPTSGKACRTSSPSCSVDGREWQFAAAATRIAGSANAQPPFALSSTYCQADDPTLCARDVDAAGFRGRRRADGNAGRGSREGTRQDQDVRGLSRDRGLAHRLSRGVPRAQAWRPTRGVPRERLARIQERRSQPSVDAGDRRQPLRRGHRRSRGVLLAGRPPDADSEQMMRLERASLLVAASFALLPVSVNAADVLAGQAKTKEVCQACHGLDGNSATPDYPK